MSGLVEAALLFISLIFNASGSCCQCKIIGRAPLNHSYSKTQQLSGGQTFLVLPVQAKITQRVQHHRRGFTAVVIVVVVVVV